MKSPAVFWSIAEKDCCELTKLAQKLLRIPASVIELKRLFCEKKHLSKDQSEKLTSLYYNLRLRDTKEIDYS